MSTRFQVELAHVFKDYSKDEDKILKRAYLAGFPNAKFKYKKFEYEVSFKDMTQKNAQTGKTRKIKAPSGLEQPSAPIVAAGPTTCIKVKPGQPGTQIEIPHPQDKTQKIKVDVPESAKPGQAMLVPIPKLSAKAEAPAPVAEAPPAEAPAAAAPPEKKGWSTGGKVAAGTAAVVGVAGLAVAGAVLGEHIAEDGFDETMAGIADGFEEAGDAIVDGAEAAGEWTEGAAEDAGDFIMDLF